MTLEQQMQEILDAQQDYATADPDHPCLAALRMKFEQLKARYPEVAQQLYGTTSLREKAGP